MEATREAAFLPVPADNEWFDLEVDDDRDPMEVVISAGYGPVEYQPGGYHSESWQYLGPELTGKHTYRVKLMRGYVDSVAEARRKANEFGCRLLEGQAREAFKAKYPVSDGNGTINFGGSEWWDKFNDPYVACLFKNGGAWRSGFGYSNYRGYNQFEFRWAVVSKDS